MKIGKRILIVLLSIVLLVEIALLVTGKWYVNKVLSMTIFSGKSGPDIDELDLFPYHQIPTETPKPWPKSVRYNQQVIPDKCIGDFIKYQTTGFVVIQHDSVLHEQYWEGYNEQSVTNSFSMAKSINAILIGIALKEGLIKSVQEPIANYIPEFSDGEKSQITIEHLLNMSSGIDFVEGYGSPFDWPAEAYYGEDANKITVSTKVKEAPGKTWNYKGGDSQLLGIILKKVTGKTVAEYASEKLWKPIGAETNAFWSTDEQGMEKVSCCFYTTAKDFARLAKLYMDSGNWEGKQLVDTAYVRASLTTANLVDIADGKKIDKYGYQWWLMKYQNHSIFYMRGIRGQYVFAIPDLDMVIVRVGHKRGPKNAEDFPEDMFTYLDAGFRMAQN